MAIQRSVNWISQARVDVPDVRAVESAVRNDFDQLIQGFVTGTTQGYVVRGFNILMAGAIGGASSGLQLNVDPGALLHIASSQSGTVYMVPAGTLPQQLNAATNVLVDGAFAPSAVNYVSIEYERYIDPTTSAQKYIWNPTTNSETTKNAPTAQIMRFRIKITTAVPAATYLPIATVITDSGNNVVSIQDDRPMLGRLGRGGVNPNPSYVYPWAQGRTENPSASSSNTIDPFFGGDKVIGNLKEWMDAVMSAFLEIKGTTYWYSASSSGSLEILREDLANTVITGRGSIAHGVSPIDKVTPTAAGQINWDQDIEIKVIGSQLSYTLLANPATVDITLADNYCAYVTLVRNIVVSPNLIFTNGLPQVTSVGAISWTGPLQAGDYLKLGSDTDSGFYEIQSVDSLTQVTLTSNFSGISTGPSGAKGKYSFGSYQTSATPSTNRHIYIARRDLVPAGQDVFWLFLRTDNAGIEPRVYIRFLGVELDQGEDRDVSDTTSQELLLYIGSASESSFAPKYVDAVSPGALAQVQTLTMGSAAQIAQNDYFFISSSGNARNYYVWFNKDGGGSDPFAPYTNASVEVPITTGMTNVQVALAVTNALNGTDYSDFLAVQLANPNDFKVTVTNTSAGSCSAAADFNLGAPFAVSVDQTGTGTGNYFIKDGDSLTLAIKELDQAMGMLLSVLDDPSYDEIIDIVASGAVPPLSLNGPVTSGTLITLPDNSRLGNIPQPYTVGNGMLIVDLNGQLQRLGVDYAEVGAPGSVSTQIQILRQLEVYDDLEIRIAKSGGGGGFGGGIGPVGPPGPAGPAGSPGSDAVGGPIAISTKNANYTVGLGDNAILADCTSGVVTLTLPPVATGIGKLYYFKKIDATANAMVIQANGSELIDGLNSQMSVVQFESFSLVTDGSFWWIL